MYAPIDKLRIEDYTVYKMADSMRFYLVSIFAFLFGCGQYGNPAVPTSTDTTELAQKYNLYKFLSPQGWSVSNGCDALLFTALHAVATDRPFDIQAAEALPGQWFRKPGLILDRSLCSSDISRDMFLGLFIYAWHFDEVELLENVWDYGKNHDWDMGEERKAYENRVHFNLIMQGILADTIYSLGGRDISEKRWSGFPVYSVSPGYLSHLTLLQLYLRGRMHGRLFDHELAAIRKILKHMGDNPLPHALLHKYTDGDQSKAVDLLMSVWPDDRLPTRSDWKEEWRLQRSDNDGGFERGKGNAPHSGGDFLFAAAIILDLI